MLNDGGAIATKNNDGVFVLGSEAQRIHPDDLGNPQEIHDFTLGANALVWQPTFLAYMLINPANCGYAGRPAGLFVTDQPATGVNETDWAIVQFGGFYAFKYQASRNDATSSAVGTGTVPTSRKTIVPWATITLDDAAKACYTAGDGGGQYHLMTNREWMAMAVYSMLLGPTVFGVGRYGPFGNNNSGADIDDAAITFTADSTQAGRALTGTGVKAGWAADVNLTSHNGKTSGVYDLNGNVFEFVNGLTARVGATGGQTDTTIYVDGGNVGLNPPGTNGQRFISLLTKPIWRDQGVPAATDANGLAEFGVDYWGFGSAASTEYIACRGGYYGYGSDAGVFALYVFSARSSTSAYIGFRAALTL
ncbi:hypothetical protein [Paradesulfitobacterium aromaticivorans]